MINVQTIAGIHGVPRSGTSWLGQIFNSHPKIAFRFQPLFSYAFKSYLNTKSDRSDIDTFFEKILSSDDYFINMRDTDIHKNYPTFTKAEEPSALIYKEVRYHHLVPHMLDQHERVKFILVVRNPLAVLTSWANAPKEFKKEWDFSTEWRFANEKNMGREEEFYGFDKWKESTQLFIDAKNKYPDRVEIVRYSDLLTDTDAVTEKLFHFCGLQKDAQCTEFIAKSRSVHHADPNSVFKTRTIDEEWKDYIPPAIADQVIRETQEAGLSQFLI